MNNIDNMATGGKIILAIAAICIIAPFAWVIVQFVAWGLAYLTAILLAGTACLFGLWGLGVGVNQLKELWEKITKEE